MRTSREVMADALRLIEQRLDGIDLAMEELPGRVAAAVAVSVDQKLGHYAVKLDQAIDAIRDTADGLSEHRQHTMGAVSDLGADVIDLKTKVRELERKTANGA